jgi:Transposase DDE domain
MPQPINLQDVRLAQYLRLFSEVFSLPQWKYFVTVLLGLLHCDERHTLSALLRQVVVKVTIFGLCHFLRRSNWSVEALTRVRQRYFYAQIAPRVAAAHAKQRAQRPVQVGRPKSTLVTGYLIMDDSTNAKPWAERQEGLGQHYSSTEKKTVNGHSWFQSLYLLEGRQLPLTPQLYRRQMTCVAEGVPFASKIDLAYHDLVNFEPPAETHTHVLVDSWYMARRLWRTARQRGWDISGGLKSNRFMRLNPAEGGSSWVEVRHYAASLTAEDFQPVTWPTQNGEKLVYAHLVTTWVRKLGPCQLLIVKLDPNDPVEKCRYFVTSRVTDTLEQVVDHLAKRWTIELLFADCKELMGADQYQMRSAQAIVRFWALGLCLYQFLDEIRATHLHHCGKRLTLGQARQQIRQSHQEAFLDWLFERIQTGATADQIRQALQPAIRL